MRINGTGLKREDLAWALGRPDYVAQARKNNFCLLCREPHVNEAGLCKVCYSLLEDHELKLATQWLSGLRP